MLTPLQNSPKSTEDATIGQFDQRALGQVWPDSPEPSQRKFRESDDSRAEATPSQPGLTSGKGIWIPLTKQVRPGLEF